MEKKFSLSRIYVCQNGPKSLECQIDNNFLIYVGNAGCRQVQLVFPCKVSFVRVMSFLIQSGESLLTFWELYVLYYFHIAPSQAFS